VIATRAPWIVAGLAAAACHRGDGSRATDRADNDPQATCRPPGDGHLATALRGAVTEPDPRVSATLTRKGYALDTAGIARALAGDGDPTAQLAALTAVSALQCRGLLARVEALLTAPPPTAVDAAATLAELGTSVQHERAISRLHDAMLDPSWPEVQVTAAAYLARAGDAASIPALRAALRSSNEAVRLQAVVSISAFAGFDGQPPDHPPFARFTELTAVLADRRRCGWSAARPCTRSPSYRRRPTAPRCSRASPPKIPTRASGAPPRSASITLELRARSAHVAAGTTTSPRTYGFDMVHRSAGSPLRPADVDVDPHPDALVGTSRATITRPAIRIEVRLSLSACLRWCSTSVTNASEISIDWLATASRTWRGATYRWVAERRGERSGSSPSSASGDSPSVWSG